jgi:hypothetical protein
LALLNPFLTTNQKYSKMDQAVSLILDAKTDQELENLKKVLESNLEKLVKSSGHLSNVFKMLDPRRHSLGMVFLLYAKALDKFDNAFISGMELLLVGLDQSQIARVPYRCTPIY